MYCRTQGGSVPQYFYFLFLFYFKFFFLAKGRDLRVRSNSYTVSDTKTHPFHNSQKFWRGFYKIPFNRIRTAPTLAPYLL